MSVSQSTSLRACLVMRAPLTRYPPSVFQAEMLEEAGVSVTVLDTEDGAHHACTLHPSIRRIVLERAPNPWAVQRFSQRLTSSVRRWLFSQRTVRWLKKLSPDLVIAYEPAAIAVTGRAALPGGFLRVWHFHEYPDASGPLSWGSKNDLEWARRHIALAEMMIFPDRRRADRFAQEMSLNTKPTVVMNCPRRLSQLPVPSLQERLHKLGHDAGTKTVLYVGVLGESHGLEVAVRGMKFWPTDTLFVLAGSGSEEFKARLRREAGALGAARRVVFLGVIKPEEIWSVRAGADVALTIMEPIDVNRLFSAGASNKRFEAMAVGVPQVTDQGPGLKEMIEQNGAGLCIPYDNPEAIGRAMAKLLHNEGLRRKMGECARRLHLDRFNYETEFRPVLERLLRRIEDGVANRQSFQSTYKTGGSAGVTS